MNARTIKHRSSTGWRRAAVFRHRRGRRQSQRRPDVWPKTWCASPPSAEADAVKFQKRTIHELLTRAALDRPYVNPNSLGATYGEHRLKLELSEADWYRLRDLATGLGLEFMGSAWDRGSADLLDALDTPAIKTPSAVLTDLDLLEYIARKGRPMIVSTGMSTARRGRPGRRAHRAPHRRPDPAAVHVGLPERVRRHQPARHGHVLPALRRAGRLFGPRARHRGQRSRRDARRVRRRAPLHQGPHAARSRPRRLARADRPGKAGARHSRRSSWPWARPTKRWSLRRRPSARDWPRASSPPSTSPLARCCAPTC